MSVDRNPLVKAFPVEIDPSQHWPATARAAVRKAMEDRYPNQIWIYRGRVVWLDLETGTISPLSLRRFRALSPRAVVYLQDKGRGDSRHKARIEVPTRVLDDVYEGDDWRELVAVRRCPWVTAEGRLVVEAGYDKESGLYLHWTDDPCDPDDLTADQIGDVLARLTDFTFADRASEVALIAMFLQAVRVLVGNPTPMGLVTALEAESAKSLVAQLVGCVVLGQLPAAAMMPDLKGEGHYSFGAYVRSETPFLWLDNVATGSTMGGSDLHAILTASTDITSRVVGTGDVGRGDPTRIQWVATGNQIGVDAEIARRVLPVQLRVRPANRPFRTPNVVRWVLQHRRLVLSVFLRIVLDWHRAGCPAPARSLPSFEGWSQLVGGPICLSSAWAEVWLSAASRPVPARDLALSELCAAWPKDQRGHIKPLAASIVLTLADSLSLLPLTEEAGVGSERSRQTKFGRMLAMLAKQERPILGWRIVSQRSSNGPLYLPLACVGGPAPPGRDMGGGGPSGEDGGAPPQKGPTGPPGPVSGVASMERSEGGGGGPPTSGEAVPPTGTGGPVGPFPQPTSSIFSEGQGEGGYPPEGDMSRDVDVVHIPRVDVAYGPVLAMAARGLPVQPDAWHDRTAEAQAHFAASTEPEDRDRLKNLQSYAGPVYLQALRGRVHCGWRLQGPGRIGTVQPCLQQITKKHGVRTAVVASEGHVFVRGDWRSAHVWIAAALAGDETLLEALRGGGPQGDLYEQATADWKTGAEQAKVSILAMLNGEGAEKLGERLGITADEAAQRRESWQGRYPRLKAWIRDRQRHRSWTTPLGRVVTLPEDKGDYTAIGWTMQSYEADALRLVLVRCGEVPVLTLHDEVLLEVPVSRAAEAEASLRDCMNEALLEVSGLPRNQGLQTVRVEQRRRWRES